MPDRDKDKVFFWWNSRTKVVERGPISKALDRVGPFETEQQAKDAERILAERAARWRAEDDSEQA